MAIINYGSATIFWNSTDLGRTAGGGSLTLNTQQWRTLRTQTTMEYVTGGTGTIDLFQLTSPIVISEDSMFHDYGLLHIACPYMHISLHSCKLFFPVSFQFSSQDQKPCTIRLAFRRSTDSLARVITIQDA
jgi:hypothetical protein